MLIAGAALLPSAAIVDYELTMSMTRRLTADTGTDSLTHAIEAYVSRKANSFTDMFAMEIRSARPVDQCFPSAAQLRNSLVAIPKVLNLFERLSFRLRQKTPGEQCLQ